MSDTNGMQVEQSVKATPSKDVVANLLSHFKTLSMKEKAKRIMISDYKFDSKQFLTEQRAQADYKQQYNQI